MQSPFPKVRAKKKTEIFTVWGKMYRLQAVVLVLLSGAVLAQSKSGTVMASGHVTVDGKVIERRGSIFPAEQLETGGRSQAKIAVDGANALVAGDSTVILREQYLDLDCGRVKVTTVDGFGVHVHEVAVAPLEPHANATFEVAQGARQLSIKALTGKLNIARGNTTSTLLPGQTRLIDDTAACKPLAAYFDWKPPVLWSAGIVPFYFDWDSGDDISPFKP